MHKLSELFILVMLIFLLPGTKTLQAQEISGHAVLLEMIDSAEAITGFTSVIRKTERIEGEMVLQVSEVKISRKPYQVYVKQLSPKSGVEILCADGCTKAIINMNGFPWVNLTLNPTGTVMRKHQHHTLHDSGFDLLSNILIRTLDEFDNKEQSLTHKSDVVWRGEEVYSIDLINHRYATRKYTVTGSENIADIAGKFNINEYAILELNPECEHYEDVRTGQELEIPSHYGTRMNLLISKKTMLPVLIRVYDAEGLFEEYEYTQLRVNPKFAADEFHESFKDYNF